MSSPGDELQTEAANPFSTRFVRPGALQYVFEEGLSAGGLVERLAALGWWAQIVGPHGSGKSTLLAHLVETLDRVGRRGVLFSLHDGQRRLSADWLDHARANSARMIIIDGYEQLGRLSRLGLKRRCRWEGWGLLVTAHEDVGFATLLRTSPSLRIAQAVIDQLLRQCDTTIDPQIVARCYAASEGNVRETLFALYDEFTKHGHSRGQWFQVSTRAGSDG